jgi:hypothetical protein
MILDFDFPIEPFNSYVRDGSVGERIQRAMATIKPESVFFSANNGQRGGIMIVDCPKASDIPRLAEPLFLLFEADVNLRPCMSAEDLAASGLEELGRKFSD